MTAESHYLSEPGTVGEEKHLPEPGETLQLQENAACGEPYLQWKMAANRSSGRKGCGATKSQMSFSNLAILLLTALLTNGQELTEAVRTDPFPRVPTGRGRVEKRSGGADDELPAQLPYLQPRNQTPYRG